MARYYDSRVQMISPQLLKRRRLSTTPGATTLSAPGEFDIDCGRLVAALIHANFVRHLVIDSKIVVVALAAGGMEVKVTIINLTSNWADKAEARPQTNHCAFIAPRFQV